MRKTFCDRCGADCATRTGYLQLTEHHQTSRGEQLGYDEYAPLELCGPCTDEVRGHFGLRIARHDEPDVAVNERAVAQLDP